MATNLKRCDICGKDCDEIVLKLYSAPVIAGKTRTLPSNYLNSLDVGNHTDCIKRVSSLGKWQRRRSREEYNNVRRLRSSNTVEAKKSAGGRKAK